MKCLLFFLSMYLGLSISALAKCSDETVAMETVEWMQQLAEGWQRVLRQIQANKIAPLQILLIASKRFASQYLVKLRAVASFIFL